MIFSEKTHRQIYLFGLLLLSIGLPTSVFLMSVSQFIIYINWFAEANFFEKWKRFKKNKALWIFLSIYIIHLLWLWPPQDYSYAMNDLRIKLPLLLFPFFVATSKPLSAEEIKKIALTFTTVITIVGIVGIVRFIFKEQFGIIDYRKYIPFISHIRYSLMLVFSIFMLTYFAFDKSSSLRMKYLLLGNSLFLIVLIFILKIPTAVFLFILLLVFYSIYLLSKRKKLWWTFIVAFIIFGIYSFIQIRQIWMSFLTAYHAFPPSEVIYNSNGRVLYYCEESKDVENGHRVYFGVQEEELKKEWDKISAFRYNGYDLKGNKLKFTLVRYLTSKGLTKDSAGIAQLTTTDIQAIEKGIPNHIYLNKLSLYPYLYSFVWDYYNYVMLHKVNGSSLFQRIEYQKAAFYIIKNNFFLGVGTGNVQQKFNETYTILQSNLSSELRHRAHNQYITFLLTFGIFGFFWIIFAFLYPFLRKLKPYTFIRIAFLFIVLISFITEDTLETQAGVTFVVFFYSLFSFGMDNN